MSDTINLQDEMLTLCYKRRNEGKHDMTDREFDCLVGLIEDGRIGSWEELAEYGIER